MSMKTPPPQAYTRDTLVEAFNWLQKQPDSVREIAKTSDVMVSLYLRAKRYGETGKIEDEAPVSGKTFKSDLKNLAEGLKAFEDGPAKAIANPAPNPAPSPASPPQAAGFEMGLYGSAHSIGSNNTTVTPHHAPSAVAHSSTQNQAAAYNSASQAQSVLSNSQSYHSNASPTPTYNTGVQGQGFTQSSNGFGNYPPGISGFEPAPRSTRPSLLNELDPRSRSLVSQVMQQLNLSSEHEALRLLISLGAQKITRSLE